MKNVVVLFIMVSLLFIIGCATSEREPGTLSLEVEREPGELTFEETGDPLCTYEGKPIVRKFATTWCPHCLWIEKTYTDVVNEYVDQGKIQAYLWEINTGDNALTDYVEAHVPAEELAIYEKYNPKKTIPTFVFGCQYVRIGNGYETQGDLAAEEAEFREIIELLLANA